MPAPDNISSDCILDNMTLSVALPTEECANTEMAIASLTGSGSTLSNGSEAQLLYLWEKVGEEKNQLIRINATNDLNDTTEGLENGQYQVMVNAGPNCSLTSTFEIKNENPTCDIKLSEDKTLLFITVDDDSEVYWYLNGDKVSSEASSELVINDHGLYTAKIFYPNGCMSECEYQLESDDCNTNPVDVELDVQYFECNDSLSNIVKAHFFGGTAPYSYTWTYENKKGDIREATEESFGSVEELKNVPAGIYSFEITDAKGCQTEAKVKIENPEECVDPCEENKVDIELDIRYFECESSVTNMLSAHFFGGEAPYLYVWTFEGKNGEIRVINEESFGSAESRESVPPGTHTFEIVDSRGCRAQKSIKVKETETIVPCEIIQTEIENKLSVEVPKDAYVKWFFEGRRINEESTLSIQISESGRYGVMIYYENGCKTQCEKDVTVENDNTTEQSECDYEVLTQSEFELGWESWIDGGSDAAIIKNNKLNAASVRLRDNTRRRSSIYTELLDLSNARSIKVDFRFMTESMEKGEDFMFEYSTDGGRKFKILEQWTRADEEDNSFKNNEKHHITSEYNLDDLNDQVVLRFRCDASNNGDKVYLDDINISVCTPTDQADEGENSTDDSPEDDQETEEQEADEVAQDDANDETSDDLPVYGVDNCFDRMISDDSFQNGKGVWIDGGSDMSRKYDSKFFKDHVIRLRDNSGKRSSMYTDLINLMGAKHLRLEMAFASINFSTDERFVFEYSIDGGNTFMTLEEWKMGENLSNDKVYQIERFYELEHSSVSAVFRLRADASANNDQILIDYVKLHVCGGATEDNSTKHDGKRVDQEGPNNIIQIENSEIETFELDITAYPNPTVNYVIIEWEGNTSKETTLEMYNVQGVQIISTLYAAYDNEAQIDLTNYPDGMYFFRLKSERYTSEMQRVIKQ